MTTSATIAQKAARARRSPSPYRCCRAACVLWDASISQFRLTMHLGLVKCENIF